MTDATDADLPRGIGRPAAGALTLAGCTRPAKDPLELHGVGPKAIRVLTEELADRGMALG